MRGPLAGAAMINDVIQTQSGLFAAYKSIALHGFPTVQWAPCAKKSQPSLPRFPLHGEWSPGTFTDDPQQGLMGCSIEASFPSCTLRHFTFNDSYARLVPKRIDY